MRANPQMAGLLNKLEGERMKSPGFLYSNSGKAMTLPTRAPVTANKARGTMSSANRAAMAGMY